MSAEYKYILGLIEKYAARYDVRMDTVKTYWHHMGIVEYVVWEYESLIQLPIQDVLDKIDVLLTGNGWKYSRT